jgi:hypothetical protein
MTRTPLLLLAAAAALAGCKPQTIDPNKVNDHTNDASNMAAKTPVALPPSISSSKIYRCADNKVVYVDWLSDGKTANIRTEKEGSPTQVAGPEAGKPLTAPGGYSIEGASGASSVKIGIPGHPAQSCTA